MLDLAFYLYVRFLAGFAFTYLGMALLDYWTR